MEQSQLLGVPLNPLLSVIQPLLEQCPQDGLGIFCLCKEVDLGLYPSHVTPKAKLTIARL